MRREYPLQTINPGDLRAARGLIATSNSGDPNREQQSWSPVNFNDDVHSSNLISTNRLVAIGGPFDGTVQNFDWEIEVIDLNNNTTRRTLIYRVTNDPSRIGSRDLLKYTYTCACGINSASKSSSKCLRSFSFTSSIETADFPSSTFKDVTALPFIPQGII